MNEIHMGKLLERAVRRKGLNLTELASALKVTRRTLYNWFKKETIDQDVMARISDVIKYKIVANESAPVIIKTKLIESPVVKGEAYWQNRYIDLLERYAAILKAKS